MEFRKGAEERGLTRIPCSAQMISQENPNRRIAIREMGQCSFKDFTEYLQHVSELRHDACMKTTISDLQSLMRRRRLGRNSGNLPGGVSKGLTSDKAQTSDTEGEIEKITSVLGEFPELQKDVGK